MNDDKLSEHISGSTALAKFDAATITRPAPVLMYYYTIIAVFSAVAFPIIFLRLYFRYRTLRFRFDDEGISLSWGILFRKEVHLTYRRIQDIHLTRNILQRWMGLATIEIQTASGSASAEMSIEGVLEAEALRDFLYTKMRGARDDKQDAGGGRPLADEALRLLCEIREEIAGLRRALERKNE
ncbi:MAG TPA: PH domain-containing protein [Blastocatellia bacterium]|nr:PH domain-containing protein [Blastocatellia bacterium]